MQQHESNIFTTYSHLNSRILVYYVISFVSLVMACILASNGTASHRSLVIINLFMSQKLTCCDFPFLSYGRSNWDKRTDEQTDMMQLFVRATL